MARNIPQLAKFAVQEALAVGCMTDEEIADHALYLMQVSADQREEAERAVAAAVRATRVMGAN